MDTVTMCGCCRALTAVCSPSVTTTSLRTRGCMCVVAFMRRSSSVRALNTSKMVCFSFFTGPRRSMCPSHASSLTLIHFTILKLLALSLRRRFLVHRFGGYATHHLCICAVQLADCRCVESPRLWPYSMILRTLERVV